MGQASFMQQLKALLHRNWTFKLRNAKTTLQVFGNYYCLFYVYTLCTSMLVVGWEKGYPSCKIMFHESQKCTFGRPALPGVTLENCAIYKKTKLSLANKFRLFWMHQHLARALSPFNVWGLQSELLSCSKIDCHTRNPVFNVCIVMGWNATCFVIVLQRFFSWFQKLPTEPGHMHTHATVHVHRFNSHFLIKLDLASY